KKVLVGTEVDFRAIVTNTTDRKRSRLRFSVVAVGCAILTGGTTSLAQNITTTFSGSGTAVAGTHTDTATASGTATDDLGHTAVVTASVQANYLGVNPSFFIVKQRPPGSTLFPYTTLFRSKKVLVGTEVDFRAIVTNT